MSNKLPVLEAHHLIKPNLRFMKKYKMWKSFYYLMLMLAKVFCNVACTILFSSKVTEIIDCEEWYP